MDEAARAEAWSSYRSMSESYTLEVRAQILRGDRGLGVALGSLGRLPRTIASPWLCGRQRKLIKFQACLRVRMA